MKILCVDDDTIFIKIFGKVFSQVEQPGDAIITTLDPQEALAIVKERSVDIVITDLVMPGISGLDILKGVKAFNPKIEVIVVTGQVSIDSAVEAMRLGARDYLTKPLNTGLLVEKLNTLREFIGRAREAEDYRFAKEIIEESAGKSVAGVEIAFGELMGVVDDIKSAVNRTIDDGEKIRYIADRILRYEKEHAA
jgi:DNA-binding NtrC family response regulator